MWDILTFKQFITQDVLIFFYYIGVILIPVVVLFSREYLVQNISLLKKLDDKIQNSLNLKEKTIILVSLFTLLFFVELGWRMIFEMMIGYFDMHDYLYNISQNL